MADDISTAVDALKKVTDVCDKIGQVYRDTRLALQLYRWTDVGLGQSVSDLTGELSSCISQLVLASDAVVREITRVQGE
jgi:hypothetical protein